MSLGPTRREAEVLALVGVAAAGAHRLGLHKR
jgi:hypothetical protein